MARFIFALLVMCLHLSGVFGCMKPIMEAMAKTTYVGCFEDRSNDRDLKNKAGSSDDMAPMKCFNMCKLFKSGWTGLQHGNECWCGTEYGYHGKVLDKFCNLECPGDKSQMCGGKGYNSIYTGPFNGYLKNAKIEADSSHLD